MGVGWLSWLGGAWVERHATLIAVVFGCTGLVWLVLDLVLPKWTKRRRGRLACLVLACVACLVAGVRYEDHASAALILRVVAGGLVLVYLARWGWNPCPRAEPRRWPHAAAAGILVLGLGVRLIDLAGWPPNINDYAAMAGTDAIDVLERGWPSGLWQGQPNDLQSGGKSPLHAPLLWLLFRTTGPNIYSVRLAEVIGFMVAAGIFWAWLARTFSAGLALLALSLFIFCPWQIAQSRMGTYQSISMAVALGLLLCADRVFRRPPAQWGWWIGLGLCAGLVGYGYAAMRVLYLFASAVLVVGAWQCRRSAHRLVGPAVALMIWLSLLAVQCAGSGSLWHDLRTNFAEGRVRMFRSSMGALATDQAIWLKTSDHRVTQEVQPWDVVLNNFAFNLLELVRWHFSTHNIHVFYAYGFWFGVLFCLAALLHRWFWVVPLYYLLGFLPCLLVFPVVRRSFAMWPLVYVALVVLAWGMIVDADRLLPWRWWRAANRTIVGLAFLVASLHGLHLFARDNSTIGIGPPFGTDHRAEMIEEIKSLLPTHHVYIVDANIQVHAFRIGLYETEQRLGKGSRYSFTYVAQGQDLHSLLRPGEPVCFAILEEPPREWVAAYLQRALPQGRIDRRTSARAGGRNVYTFYFLPPAEAFTPTP